MSHDPYAPPTTAVSDIESGAPRMRPWTAIVGVWMLVSILALNLVGTLVSVYLQRAEFGAVGDIASIALVVSFVLVSIVFGLVFWCLWFVAKGRNWARIVATVVFALLVLGGVYGFVMSYGSGPIETLIAIVSLALQVAGIVLLYVPKSNAWFAHRD